MTIGYEDRQVNASSAPLSGDSVRWLMLKEASEFLGVHFTTLRGWADRGESLVFRTLGGHRRFSLDDLCRFLSERARALPAPNSYALVEAAVDQVRLEMQRTDALVHRWHQPADTAADTAVDQVHRERGRMLFSLAISYVMKPQQREHLLESAHELGRQYGTDAASTGITLAETGRAVRFFRQQLIDAVRSNRSERPDSDDIQVERRLNGFLDEVLCAVLDGYEARLTTMPAPVVDGRSD